MVSSMKHMAGTLTFNGEVLEQIQMLISKNTAQRGMAGVDSRKDLMKVAEDLYQSKRVLIVTGFCIPSIGVGETDGPLGALSLAHALKRLHKEVLIVTDTYSEALLRAGLEVLKEEIHLLSIGGKNLEKEDIVYLKSLIFDAFSPDYLVGIERPGRSESGHCYTMMGKDITEYVPDTDFIFETCQERHIPTASIGDGGNEVGMGKIKDYVEKHVLLGDRICAKVATDYLIVAGTSNWGAHALSALLSLSHGKSLMYPAEIEMQILEAVVTSGGVDGVTSKRHLTVDGLSTYTYLQVYSGLYHLVEEILKS